ncbi:MAG TPA: Cof-type HAD-IIB family hydrolase [Firmicutes bacterium]|nr:Cof-type HAD-IIB family hydrolase [Bacillota bacterium]
MYKLIAVDVDGTLLDSNKNLTTETINAIHQAVEKGLIFTICTGRPIQGVEPLIEKIGLDLPFITYNGAMIVMGKSREILFEVKMSNEDVKVVVELGQKYGTTTIIWVDNKLYVQQLTQQAYDYGEMSKTKPLLIKDLNELIDKGVTKVLWYDQVETIAKFQNEVGPFLNKTINYHISQPFLLEFVDIKASKAKSLARLGGYFGIKQEEIIAIGDGYNDLSMIEYAGLGVAMANAEEAIKNRADYVTLSNDKNGVAHVIYRFVLANTPEPSCNKR